jgi:hypothetical protein
MPADFRLTELLARWRELRRLGQAVSPEELCRDCPELLPQWQRVVALMLSVADNPKKEDPELLPQLQRVLAMTATASTQDHPINEPPSTGLPGGPSGERPTLAAGLEPVPGYVLVRQLGAGGFGEVWEATAPGGFRVAFKFVSLGGKAGEAELRSLEVIKNLRHPNLLTIFGTWINDGCLIIGMELADRTLLDRFREAAQANEPGIPFRELLGYCWEAAKGIDYLNKPRHFLGGPRPVGVQHADIKPPNVFLFGGGVKVGDFGLVRILEQARGRHHGGLTPSYAAPEILDGQISRWSDQYSLAVTYCQMRGGRLPFPGRHRVDPPDLTMVPEKERPAVARALSIGPRERWPNCRAFVKALRNAELGELLRPVAFVGGGSRPPQSKPDFFEGHADSVWAVAFSPDGGRVLSGSLDRTLRLWDVATRAELRRFEGHAEGVTSVGFAPDGRRALSAGLDGTARVWEVDTGREVGRFDGHGGRVLAVAFTPDGRHAVSCGEDQSVRLWEVESGREQRRFLGHARWVNAVAVSPDGQALLSGAEDGTARVWDVATGRETGCYCGHRGPVKSVALSPDGCRGVTGSADHTAVVLELATGREVCVFRGHSDWVRCVTFSADGRRVLSGGDDETLRLWDAETATEVPLLGGRLGGVGTDALSLLLRYLAGPFTSFLSVAVAPDGRLLAGGDDGLVYFWS